MTNILNIDTPLFNSEAAPIEENKAIFEKMKDHVDSTVYDSTKSVILNVNITSVEMVHTAVVMSLRKMRQVEITATLSKIQGWKLVYSYLVSSGVKVILAEA